MIYNSNNKPIYLWLFVLILGVFTVESVWAQPQQPSIEQGILSKLIEIKYNSELYDLSHLSSYNSNDSEIIDGFHGGEVTYIRMLIKILESNSVLKNVTNIEKLKLDLKNKRNNYQVY